jgi:hypothetical protein
VEVSSDARGRWDGLAAGSPRSSPVDGL